MARRTKDQQVGDYRHEEAKREKFIQKLIGITSIAK